MFWALQVSRYNIEAKKGRCCSRHCNQADTIQSSSLRAENRLDAAAIGRRFSNGQLSQLPAVYRNEFLDKVRHAQLQLIISP